MLKTKFVKMLYNNKQERVGLLLLVKFSVFMLIVCDSIQVIFNF